MNLGEYRRVIVIPTEPFDVYHMPRRYREPYRNEVRLNGKVVAIITSRGYTEDHLPFEMNGRFYPNIRSALDALLEAR